MGGIFKFRSEMQPWLEVCSCANSASKYDAAHHAFSISGAKHLYRLGGFLRGASGLEEVLRAAVDIPVEWLRSYIDIKEAFALHEVLFPLVEARPELLQARTITMGADSKNDVPRGVKGQGIERAHAQPNLRTLVVTWRLGLHYQVTMKTA